MTMPLLPVFMNARPCASRQPATLAESYESIIEHALAVHGYNHDDDAHLAVRTAIRCFAQQALAIVDAQTVFLETTSEHRYATQRKREEIASSTVVAYMRAIFMTHDEVTAERVRVAGPPPTDADYDEERRAEEREALAQARRDGEQEAA